MNIKRITIGLAIILILIIVGISLGNKNQSDQETADQNSSQNRDIVAIRSFMAQPTLDLEYVTTKSPTNFSVAVVEPISDKGDTRSTSPDEWKRSIKLYRQQKIDAHCQLYTYEVDARNNQVVQVQVENSAPIGTELANEQGMCQNRLITASDAEAKQIAAEYLQRNVPNYEQIKDQFKYTEGDRHIWLYEDESYIAPEGLTSAPYQYPTIRIILSRQGYLMSYINTTGLYRQ